MLPHGTADTAQYSIPAAHHGVIEASSITATSTRGAAGFGGLQAWTVWVKGLDGVTSPTSPTAWCG